MNVHQQITARPLELVPVYLHFLGLHLCAQRIAYCALRPSTASFPLIESIKDFDAVLFLLTSDQPPELRFQPCARVRDEREIEVAHPRLHAVASKLVFDPHEAR